MPAVPMARLGPAWIIGSLLLLTALLLLGIGLSGYAGEAGEMLPRAGTLAGLLAAVFALAATPAALTRTPAPPPVLEGDLQERMGRLLTTLAEEMARLKRDGGEVSRRMSEAALAGKQMCAAARNAVTLLDESAERSAVAAEALALLPKVADGHAKRIEGVAERAESAFAVVRELPSPSVLRALLDQVQALGVEAATAEDGAVERLEALEARLQEAAAAVLGATTALEAQAVPGIEARLAAAATGVAQAVGALDARLEAWPAELAPPLADAAREVRAATEALSTRIAAMPDVAPLHESAARIEGILAENSTAQDAMVAVAEQRLRDAAAELAARIAALPEAAPLHDAATRIEGLLAQTTTAQDAMVAAAGQLIAAGVAQQKAAETSAASLEAAGRTVGEAAGDVFLATAGLQRRLPALESAAGQIEASAAALDVAAECIRPAAESLGAVVVRLTPAAEALLQAAEAPQRAALRLAEAAEALEHRAREAAAPPSPPAAPDRSGTAEPASVAASILQRLEQSEAPRFTQALRQLDGVETTVAALLREAEGLLDGENGDMPRDLAQCTPEILAGLETTIHRLRSVSTAMAMLADRPPAAARIARSA